MKLTLLLPTWSKVSASDMSSAMPRWLARGDRHADVAPGRDVALRECFEFTGTLLPIAALTRSLDANDAPSAQWLRADPAYVMADAVTLRLLACGNLDLSPVEIEAFGRVLKPLFGDAGFLLETTRPERWYAQCPREAKLPKFSAPEDALGDDLAHHQIEGENAQRWRGLLNEVQIVLTQHPLNAQRTQRGLPPMNSLWFWGAGMLPDWVRTTSTQVFSDDEIVLALTRLAKVSCSTPADFEQAVQSLMSIPSATSPPGGEKQAEEADVSLLLDLYSQRDVAALERDWFAPIDNALARRKITELQLLFASGERATIKPAHRWRFWRRVKPLA